MKTFLVMVLIIFQSITSPQVKTEERNLGTSVKYLDNNTVTLMDSNRHERSFFLGKRHNLNKSDVEIPIFSFFWWVDTSATKDRYYLDQVLPIASDYEQLVIGDINKNSLNEIYGITKDYYTLRSEIWCYEENEEGNFNPVYKYPENTIDACSILDLDRNGTEELHLLGEHLDSSQIGYVMVQDQIYFDKTSDTSLAKHFLFDYNIWQGTGSYIQLNDLTYGDFDLDDTTDIIFFNFSPKQVRITKYNPADLTFDSLIAWNSVWDSTGWGEDMEDFIIGDFDLDGKTDIMYSTTFGNIYVVENEGIDHYQINWKGNSGIYNSYIDFKTNDIDGNGKPEFWVGGEDFNQNITKIVSYEMVGDNRYEPVCEIQFPDMVSLYNLFGQSIDIDNDGTEEIFITVANITLIIKFCGNPGKPEYKIYYSHSFDYHIMTAAVYKFPNKSYPKIAVSMMQVRGDHYKYLTYLLSKNEMITSAENELPAAEFDLSNNYPNPFNPSTKIKFNIAHEAFVNLTVFSSLGERITELKNEVMPSGSYEAEFNASNLPSGVYFYSLRAGEFTETKKMILLR